MPIHIVQNHPTKKNSNKKMREYIKVIKHFPQKFSFQEWKKKQLCSEQIFFQNPNSIRYKWNMKFKCRKRKKKKKIWHTLFPTRRNPRGKEKKNRVLEKLGFWMFSFRATGIGWSYHMIWSFLNKEGSLDHAGSFNTYHSTINSTMDPILLKKTHIWER